MMSTKTRLAALEKRESVSKPVRIFVHFEGEKTGMCDGVEMTLAEWNAIKGDDCTEIFVRDVEEDTP